MKQYLKKFLLKFTPLRIKRMLASSIERYNHIENGYAQITYSQQGEDLELNRLFPGVDKGFYVDVGAFHPLKYSNTYKLYEKGWRGVNIEPNPEQQALFKKCRPEDINLNIGVSSQRTALKYYSFNEPAVNTFDEKHAATWSAVKGFTIKAITEIPTEPLSDIFEKYAIGKKIDLLNIDVEGMDMDVLRSNDWTTYRPYVILAEDPWYTRASLQESEIYQFLCANDYSLWNIIGITIFFVDKSQIQNN